MEQIKFIIFDADGTIFDSMPNYAHAFTTLLKKYGVSQDESRAYLYSSAGLVPYEQFQHMLTKHRIQADIQTLVDEYFSISNDKVVPIYDDAIPVLRNLSNYTKILSTNTRQEILDVRVRHYGLDKFFDKCLGTNGFKAKEEHFDAIKKAYGLARDFKEKVIFVGDGQSDMKLAIKYGIIGIGRVGTTSAETLKEAGATYTINSLHELESILKTD